MATLWKARSAHAAEASSVHPVHLWPSLVGGGIALLVLGAIGLLLAGVTTMLSVLVFGVLLALGGLVELSQAYRVRGQRRGLFVYLLAGVVSLVAGILLMFNPIAGAMWLTLVVAFLLIAGGAARLFAATMQDVPASGWAVASGALTGLLGVLLLIDFPASSFWSIGVIVSTNLIVTGFAHVLLGFELRHLTLGGIDRAAGPAGAAGVGPARAT